MNYTFFNSPKQVLRSLLDQGSFWFMFLFWLSSRCPALHRRSEEKPHQTGKVINLQMVGEEYAEKVSSPSSAPPPPTPAPTPRPVLSVFLGHLLAFTIGDSGRSTYGLTWYSLFYALVLFFSQKIEQCIFHVPSQA